MPCLNLSSTSCQEAMNTLSSHTRLQKVVLNCEKLCCEKCLYSLASFTISWLMSLIKPAIQRAGCFQRVLHHLSDFGEMAQPSNRHPIHTKRQFLPLIGQYSGLEDQNRLEATSYQKLATDGASPELTLIHTECL